MLLRQASPWQGQLQLQQPLLLPLATLWPSASLAPKILPLALSEHGPRQVPSAAIALERQLLGGISESRRACLASQPSMHWSPASLAFDEPV